MTQLAGNQNTSTSAAGSILVNFFEAHNVGHVIEALHYCLGHHMCRERILWDLDELLQATEWLVEGRLEYEEALKSYFQRFVRLNGGDTSRIFSVDDVHLEFV